MPKKKLPADLNARAKSIVDLATSEEPESLESYAVQFARKGGLAGGPARAKKLTAEQRSEIAKKAAKARWNTSGE